MCEPSCMSESDDEDLDSSATDVSVEDVMTWYSERVSEIWQNADLSFKDLGFPDIQQQVFKKDGILPSNPVPTVNEAEVKPSEKKQLVVQNGEASSSNDEQILSSSSEQRLKTEEGIMSSDIILDADDDNYISSEDEFEYNESDFEFENAQEVSEAMLGQVLQKQPDALLDSTSASQSM